MAEYIEREAAVESFMSEFPDAHYPSWYAEKLKELPTADVAEVLHGEWTNIADYGGGNCFANCSVCGTQTKAENPTVLKFFKKHCSWCGAKMDGRGDTDES